MLKKRKYTRFSALVRIFALTLAFILGFSGMPAVYADDDADEIEEGLEELEDEKDALEDQAYWVAWEQNYTSAQLAQITSDMAELEAQMGVKASYYFRIGKGSNQPECIKRIAALGHEIGYHYEDMSLWGV